MAIVEFTMDNAEKCKCVKCPVQAQSVCAQDRIQKVMDQQELKPEGERAPDPQMMPGLYCAEVVGKSSCDDLDFEQACICGGCLVHQDNNLKSGYYCRMGSAEVNG